MKRITFACCFSASLMQNIRGFGVENYFADHQTYNAIHGFRDSFQVLETLGCYYDSPKFEQISVQDIQGN